MAIKLSVINADERKRRYLEAEVHTSGGKHDSDPLNASLESNDIFGSNAYSRINSHKDMGTYNRRGYIQLAIPTVNYVLAGRDGKRIAKILGIDASLMKDILDCSKVYTRKSNWFVPLSKLPHEDDLVIGAQCLKLLIDRFNLEKEIIEECYNVLLICLGGLKCTMNDVKKAFTISRGSGEHLLIGDYYFNVKEKLNHQKIGRTLNKFTDYLYSDVLSHKEVRITYLINLKNKDVLYGTLNTIITVVPKALRPSAENRPSPITRMYASILKCNHDLESFTGDMTGDHAGFGTIVSKYKALDRACSTLQLCASNKDKQNKSILESVCGKKGKIRGAMFSKKQNYSGRAAVVVDPYLSLRNVVIPEKMLPKLMRYHLIANYGVKIGKDPNSKGLRLSQLRDDSEQGIRKNIKRLTRPLTPGGNSILELVPVLLGRQPTLHLQGINAFRAKPGKSNAIGVSPLVCPGYNMDFDGDTAHTQVPLSAAAIRDYTEFLDVTKNMFLAKNGECTICPRMDMIYGMYVCTRSHYRLGRSVKRYESLEEVRQDVMYQRVNVSDTVTVNGTDDIAGYLAFRASFTKDIVLTGGVFETTREEFVAYNSACNDAKRLIDAKVRQIKRNLLTTNDMQTRSALNEELARYSDLKGTGDDVPEIIRKYQSLCAQAKVKEQAHKATIAAVKNRIPIREITSRTIKTYVREIWEYGINAFVDTTDRLVELGFRVAEIHTPSMSVFDGGNNSNAIEEYDTAIDTFDKYMEEERELYMLGMEEQSVYEQQFSDGLSTLVKEPIIETLYQKLSDKNGYRLLAECGARGSKDNLLQIFSYKGQVSKSDTESFNVIIKNCYSQQLTPMEHFLTAYGGRKGQIAKSLKTSDTGYAARKMWHASHSIMIRERDCGTTRGLPISKKYLASFVHESSEHAAQEKIKSVFKSMIEGRYQIIYNQFDKNAKPNIRRITPTLARELAETEDVVIIRSPLTCKNPCCAVCYGDDPMTHSDVALYTPVGLIAAHSIGEPGTQMVMKVFQKGGVAGKGDVSSSFDKLNMFLSISEGIKSTATYDPIAWADGPIHVDPLVHTQTIYIGDSKKHKVKLPLGTPMKKVAVKGEGLCAVNGDHYIPELETYARGNDKEEWLNTLAAQQYLITTLFFIYLNEQEIKLQHFEIMAAAMTRHMIISTDRKDLKVGVYCSTRKLLSGDVSHTVYRTRLLSFKYVPLRDTNALSRIMMEEVGGGIAECVFLGLEDECEDTLQRILTCQPVLSRKELNDYRNSHVLKL